MLDSDLWLIYANTAILLKHCISYNKQPLFLICLLKKEFYTVVLVYHVYVLICFSKTKMHASGEQNTLAQSNLTNMLAAYKCILLAHISTSNWSNVNDYAIDIVFMLVST